MGRRRGAAAVAAYADAPVIGGAVAAAAFDHGVALPSGSALTDAEVDEAIGVVRATVAG